MSKFFCKSLLLGRYYDKSVKNPIGYNPLSLRWLSSSVSIRPNEPSFTVSYLINSLGFSPEVAKTMSKHLSFETSHKPDQAIEFVRSFGFTQTQIPKIVRSFPQILLSDIDRTILPKLEFLENKGISRPELVKSLSCLPSVLGCSLENKIIPRFESLRTFFTSEAKTIAAVKNNLDILAKDIEKFVLPNVSALRLHGVPDSNIAKFICSWSKSMIQDPVRFREAVGEVYEIGFCPSKITFLIAICAKVYKSKWESKVGHYKKLGWSENDISRAFLKYPWCMTIKEDKITSVMDFLTSETGMKPINLADWPMVFTFSLKKRIMPRVRVFRALEPKGLLKKRYTLYSILVPTEKAFLKRYVTPYVNVAPELMKMYKDEEKKNRIFQSDYRELEKFERVNVD